MHPAQIQSALKMRGFTQADVAEQLQVTATTISSVVAGRSRSKRAEMFIAQLTGLTLAELWPQWHGARGRRLSALTKEQVVDALCARAG